MFRIFGHNISCDGNPISITVVEKTFTKFEMMTIIIKAIVTI